MPVTARQGVDKARLPLRCPDVRRPAREEDLCLLRASLTPAIRPSIRRESQRVEASSDGRGGAGRQAL